ncbi:hypothetical protein NLC35_00870 [Candidatus Aminicenantes bacterium AC-334-K16]|jgi:hypothetical protein|nr:hypothetical protein [Candidatus Aminicenantes bacterium AC-334-K16]
MKPEVKERLITGLIQYLNANSSGSSRLAVADSYLAIDNYFAAILIDKGIDPTRNHRQKLRLMLLHFGELLRKANATQEDLVEFYDCWQKVRYSSIVLKPNKILYFLRLSSRIISAILSKLASQNGMSYEELEEELYTEILGDRWLNFDEKISYIHEIWQHEAEVQGEMGIGSKLLNKMLNPSNFCEILVLADDEVTKEIIAKDSEFASKVADFYQSFLKLILYVQNARLEKGVTSNEVTNFMLSLKLRYHGQSMDEIVYDWGEMIAKVVESFNLKSRKDQDGDNKKDL